MSTPQLTANDNRTITEQRELKRRQDVPLKGDVSEYRKHDENKFDIVGSPIMNALQGISPRRRMLGALRESFVDH
jgi:hypothetical protein